MLMCEVCGITGKQEKVPGGAPKAVGSKSASAASHLSGLWTKAPLKKQQAAVAEPAKAASKGRGGKKAAAAPAADADAALKAAQEVRTTTAKAVLTVPNGHHDARPVQSLLWCARCHSANAERMVQVESSDDDDDDDFLPTQRGNTRTAL